MLWGVYESLDLRWSTLGIPICTAYGAACAIFATLLFPCGASDVAREASEAAVASLVAAMADAVAAYASVDPSEREMRRARADTFRRDAERHLAALPPTPRTRDGSAGRSRSGLDPRSSRSSSRDRARPNPGGGAARSRPRRCTCGACPWRWTRWRTRTSRGGTCWIHRVRARTPRGCSRGSARVDGRVGRRRRRHARGAAALGNVKEEDVVGAEARARLAGGVRATRRDSHGGTSAALRAEREILRRRRDGGETRATGEPSLRVFVSEPRGGDGETPRARGCAGEGSEEAVCETCETPSSERASGAEARTRSARRRRRRRRRRGRRVRGGRFDTIGALGGGARSARILVDG